MEAFRGAGEVDQSSWSTERKKAYAASRSAGDPAPIAILTISRLGLSVPVLDGIDGPALDRGAGHIPETSRPGEGGNVGIAAHRDGFFRCLKDVRAGDELELEARGVRERYVVERAWIVEPDDVSVLDPTPAPSVTLVTCYPFYFVGSAPHRFIVRAVRAEETAARSPNRRVESR